MKTEEIYNSVLDTVAAVMDEVRDDILAQMEGKGINASGRTSASLGVRRYEGGIRLGFFADGERIAPTETLEVGRPGGNVPKGFTAILYQWSIDKGIPFEKDSRRRSFAYLLGRRIQREGTLRHSNPTDVYSTAVTVGLEKIKARIASELKAKVTAALHDELINR